MSDATQNDIETPVTGSEFREAIRGLEGRIKAAERLLAERVATARVMIVNEECMRAEGDNGLSARVTDVAIRVITIGKDVATLDRHYRGLALASCAAFAVTWAALLCLLISWRWS